MNEEPTKIMKFYETICDNHNKSFYKCIRDGKWFFNQDGIFLFDGRCQRYIKDTIQTYRSFGIDVDVDYYNKSHQEKSELKISVKCLCGLISDFCDNIKPLESTGKPKNIVDSNCIGCGKEIIVYATLQNDKNLFATEYK